MTLNDDRFVTEELLSANFLVPSDENVNRGKSLAELCCKSLKDFNPMVSVSVEKGWDLFVLYFIINSLTCIVPLNSSNTSAFPLFIVLCLVMIS